MSAVQTIRKGVIYSEYTVLQNRLGEFYWTAGVKGRIRSQITFEDRVTAEADIIRTFGSL